MFLDKCKQNLDRASDPILYLGSATWLLCTLELNLEWLFVAEPAPKSATDKSRGMAQNDLLHKGHLTKQSCSLLSDFPSVEFPRPAKEWPVFCLDLLSYPTLLFYSFDWAEPCHRIRKSSEKCRSLVG